MTKDFVEKKIKEFKTLFVEPIDTKLRAMNLNNEPYIMGKAQDAYDFLEDSLHQARLNALEDLPRNIEIEKSAYEAVERYKKSLIN